MDEPGDHESPGDATQLLERASRGDAGAVDGLLPLVYAELRARAGAYFRGQPSGHTLQPTALVHDAYLRLVKSPGSRWSSRSHFCAVAATAMRQILTNHAKRRALAQAARGNVREATLVQSPSRSEEVDLLALDEAMDKLAGRNAERARLIELRFFGGLNNEEVATVLGTSESTVKREWRKARAWLLMELRGDGAP